MKDSLEAEQAMPQSFVNIFPDQESMQLFASQELAKALEA